MTTEYVIFAEYYYKRLYDYYNDEDKNYTINKYLLKKFKNLLTDKINKNELLNIKFEKTGIKFLYLSTNQKIIKTIKEINKNKLDKSFIFIRIKNGFEKYFYFKDDIKGFNDYFNKIVFCNKDYYNKDTSDYFKCYTFICAYFDINKYYQDLILSGLNQEEMKNKFINNLNDIISFSFNGSFDNIKINNIDINDIIDDDYNDIENPNIYY